MKVLSLLLIIMITLPYFSISLSIASQNSSRDPVPIGISTFSLSPSIVTNFVMGVANISSIHIGKSYIGLSEYSEGNASLQLNAVLDNEFWLQNVALFQQTSNSLKITFVINIWNLSGNFYIKNNNITNYQGLGVLIYVGPTFNVSLPLTLILYMKTNSTATEFGYILNNVKKVYYIFPVGGKIFIGGFSSGVGIPNSLEFVWGGPGDGSSVYMNVSSTMLIYYLDENNSLRIPPIAYNFGFVTAEGVYNLNTIRGGEIFSPYALTVNSEPLRNILWPIPPQIVIEKINNTLYVTLSLNGKPVPNQQLVVKNIFFQNIAYGVTNQSGVATINNISANTYIVYYPGNFTLSDSYVFNSEILQGIYGYLKSEFDNLINFINNLNITKHITSMFSKETIGQVVNTEAFSRENVNIAIIVAILSFIFGFIIAIILSRKI